MEKETGSAAATGDGDVMMRFLPAYQAIVNLRMGLNPWQSAQEAISRIAIRYPATHAAIIVVSIRGEFGEFHRNLMFLILYSLSPNCCLSGAACHGFDRFPFSVMRSDFSQVSVITVNCTKAMDY